MLAVSYLEILFAISSFVFFVLLCTLLVLLIAHFFLNGMWFRALLALIGLILSFTTFVWLGTR